MNNTKYFFWKNMFKLFFGVLITVGMFELPIVAYLCFKSSYFYYVIIGIVIIVLWFFLFNMFVDFDKFVEFRGLCK